MSRTFVDHGLLEWEVYPSGSRRGLAVQSAIIFRCTSDRSRRARFIETEGDVADAERAVRTLPEDRLRGLLADSREVP